MKNGYTLYDETKAQGYPEGLALLLHAREVEDRHYIHASDEPWGCVLLKVIGEALELKRPEDELQMLGLADITHCLPVDFYIHVVKEPFIKGCLAAFFIL